MGNDTVFVRDREIVYSGILDAENVGKVILSIRSMVNEDNEKEANLKNFKREPIHLHISSTGGSVYHTLGLYDLIETSRTPIITYGHGCIMSAAVILFLAGYKRVCGKHATFMMHEASQGMNDYASIIHKKSEEISRLENLMRDIVVNRTKVSGKQYDKWNNEREVYLSAEDALKFGIVHEIL